MSGRVGARAIPVLLLILACAALPAQDLRGLKNVRLADQQGAQAVLYKSSYALVIGVSNYTNGWPKLPGVPKDIEAVAEALKGHGFTVVMVRDPARDRLFQAFDSFINQYGQEKENSLLLYFAGHGHTVDLSYGDKMGYIVPADAPSPVKDPGGFVAKALDLQMIDVYSKRIQAKHALFLFDSCFSGSLMVSTRAIPADISYKAAQPVRQYITSGSEGEEVPDQSIFREQFVAALRGEADLNRDGYLTGTELSSFLTDTVINYSRGNQHPQYAKIRQQNLDKGDFVFQFEAAAKASAPAAKAEPQSPAPAADKGHAAAASAPQAPAVKTLAVTSEPPGAAVSVNGVRKGTTPVQVKDVPEGELSVKAELTGFETAEQQVLITPYRDDYSLALALKPSRTVTTGRIGLALVPITAGSFAMGETFSGQEEKPTHKVTLTRDYQMGEFEVTNGQYCAVLNWALEQGKARLAGGDVRNPAGVVTFLGIRSMHGDQFGIAEKDGKLTCLPGRESHPVVGVTWHGAAAFCNFLSEMEGKQPVYDLVLYSWDRNRRGFRLPTEAEWEYAARGTDGRKYPWGNNISGHRANYASSGDPFESQQPPFTQKGGPTTPAGFFNSGMHDSFPTEDGSSAFGLYDMSGNVSEWCWDLKGSYSTHDQADPAGPTMGAQRVYRGGSWRISPNECHATGRAVISAPDKPAFDIGFRVAADF
jgi:formylglycine-generating enzyme required for sulfatase activity